MKISRNLPTLCILSTCLALGLGTGYAQASEHHVHAHAKKSATAGKPAAPAMQEPTPSTDNGIKVESVMPSQNAPAQDVPPMQNAQDGNWGRTAPETIAPAADASPMPMDSTTMDGQDMTMPSQESPTTGGSRTLNLWGNSITMDPPKAGNQ